MIFIVLLAILIVLITLRIKVPDIKGAVGERAIAITLSQLNSKEYKVINDVILRNKNNRTSQIDHIVVSIYGIFVIETKNYKGWIFGQENAEFWKQVIYKKHYRFRNPVKQNFSHIYTLKENLSAFKIIKYFPIIVFLGEAELRAIDSSVPVIYRHQLNTVIKRLSNTQYLSKEDVYTIVNIIKDKNLKTKENKTKHITEIKNTVLENQLKQENLICPKCNSELKLREGRYGKFYGCSNYPKCRFTMKY